jgi:hypothetical protein
MGSEVPRFISGSVSAFCPVNYRNGCNHSILDEAPETMSSLVELQSPVDPARGRLVVLECGRQVPFDVLRVFLLLDVPQDAVRGNHAHRGQHQLIVPIRGRFEVETVDREGTKRFTLGDPGFGLHLPPLTWLVMTSADTLSSAMVLASEPYSEQDYIRDRAEFERLARQ